MKALTISLVPLEAAACQHHPLPGAEQLDRPWSGTPDTAPSTTMSSSAAVPVRTSTPRSSRPLNKEATREGPRTRIPSASRFSARARSGARAPVRKRMPSSIVSDEHVRSGPHAGKPIAQLRSRVERHRFDRSAGPLSARQVGVVVGEHRRGAHAQRRLGLQIVEHLGRGVDVGLDELRVGLAAEGQAADVGEGILTRVGLAQIGHVPVHRDPRHPARHGGGPADQIGLLQQQNLRPAVVRRGWRPSVRPRPNPAPRRRRPRPIAVALM